MITRYSVSQRKGEDDRRQVAAEKPDATEPDKSQSQSPVNGTDQILPPPASPHLPRGEETPRDSDPQQQQQGPLQQPSSMNVTQQQEQQKEEVGEKQNRQDLPQNSASSDKHISQQQQQPARPSSDGIPPLQNSPSDDKQRIRSMQQQQPAVDVGRNVGEVQPQSSDDRRSNSGSQRPDNQPLIPTLNASLTAGIPHRSSVPDGDDGRSSSRLQRGEGGGEQEVLRREERSVVQEVNAAGTRDQQHAAAT